MTQPELTRLLHEVGAVSAPAADYGAAVRATVARRRLVRTGALVAGGLVVLGVLGGAAAALTGGDDAVTAADPTPTLAPTPSEEPTEEPTPTPTPEPTPTPTPTPQPTPARTTAPPVVRTTAPPVVRTTTPAPRVTTAAPRPYAGPGLSVTLSAARQVSDGTAVAFSVSVRDNDGKVLSATIDFGDGTTDRFSLGGTCGSRSGTSPEPLSASTTRSHRYLGPGSYTARLTVQTGSSCRSTPKETDSDGQTVDVV